MYVLLATALLVGSAAWTSLGCNSSSNCKGGELCECRDGYDCYPGCEGDGCNTYCHQMKKCGSVCDDHCQSRCDNMDDCSTACGSDCLATCSHTANCGVICGAGCNYRCDNTTNCGVHAGPNSVIECNNVSVCEVACDGPCQLTCNNVGTPCKLSCPPSMPLNDCRGGRFACGPC